MTGVEEGGSIPLIPPGMTFPDIAHAFRYEGYGDEEPKTESEQFIAECMDWIEKWFEYHLDNAALDSVRPFLFLFDPSRRTNEVLENAHIQPSFRHAKDLTVGGRTYATSVNFRQVYAIDSSYKTGPDALGFLVESNYTHLAAVVVCPSSRSAFVHHGDDIDCASFIPFKRTATGDFDFSQLDAHLETFYNDYVATHEGDCDIWAEANKRKLKAKPERQIQGSLHGYFRHGVLPKSARIDREIQTYAGREDIRIIRAKKNQALEAAVMELKVLAPTKSKASNLDWAKKGVDQAVRYDANDQAIVQRYVCCYDAQKSDNAMPEAAAYAKDKKITWRRYFMETPNCKRKISDFDS